MRARACPSALDPAEASARTCVYAARIFMGAAIRPRTRVRFRNSEHPRRASLGLPGDPSDGRFPLTRALCSFGRRAGRSLSRNVIGVDLTGEIVGSISRLDTFPAKNDERRCRGVPLFGHGGIAGGANARRRIFPALRPARSRRALAAPSADR